MLIENTPPELNALQKENSNDAQTDSSNFTDIIQRLHNSLQNENSKATQKEENDKTIKYLVSAREEYNGHTPYITLPSLDI